MVQVLKNFEDVNSIQQRACRAIGSLAQEKRNISKMLDLYVFVQNVNIAFEISVNVFTADPKYEYLF